MRKEGEKIPVNTIYSLILSLFLVFTGTGDTFELIGTITLVISLSLITYDVCHAYCMFREKTNEQRKEAAR